MYISNPNLKTVVYVAAYNSKVPAVQAGALQLLSIIIR